MMPMRLLIVDDHVGFRRIASASLGASGFEVVSAVGTGQQALDAADELRPDVVLLDVHLPDVIGFDIVGSLQSLGAVVVLTSSRSAEDFGDRLSATTADGFVPKDELSGSQLTAIVLASSEADR